MTDLPPWQPVDSSNIEAVQYDADTGTLGVRFRNGGVYSYRGVPAEVAVGLVQSDSPGKYFHQIIKYSYETL